MAKMIMMNELNKRANLLIEQLEVITFFPRFPLRLSAPLETYSSPNIQLTVDVLVMERLQPIMQIGRICQVATYANRWGS